MHYLLSTKQHTDTVRDWLVNVVERSAATEPDFPQEMVETEN